MRYKTDTMETTIDNNVQNLQVNRGNDIYEFPKHSCRIGLRNNVLTIRDVSDDRGEVVTLNSDDVTSPSETNNTALALTLIGFLDTGVGASTVAALQIIDTSITDAVNNITVSQPNSATATIPTAFTLNDSTSVKIADVDSGRKYIHICNNDTQKDVWIKLQAASIDSLKKGILLEAKGNTGSHFTLDASIYRGEISAIAESGTPVVNVTEF